MPQHVPVIYLGHDSRTVWYTFKKAPEVLVPFTAMVTWLYRESEIAARKALLETRPKVEKLKCDVFVDCRIFGIAILKRIYASLGLDEFSIICVVWCLEMIVHNRICALYTDYIIVHGHLTVIIVVTCLNAPTPICAHYFKSCYGFGCQLVEPYGFSGDH